MLKRYYSILSVVLLLYCVTSAFSGIAGKTGASSISLSKSKGRSLFHSVLPIQKDVPAVPDVVIVKWRSQGLAKALNGGSVPVLQKVGAGQVKPLFQSALSKTSGIRRITRVSLPAGTDVYEAAEKLSRSSDVTWAEPLYVSQIVYTPNDPDQNRQWYLNKVMADEAFEIFKNAKGALTNTDVIIAVVDNGVDLSHEDLADNLWKNPGEIPNNGLDDDGNGYTDDVYGWDFSNDDNNPAPDPGSLDGDKWHGTGVAGVASSVTDNDTGIAALGCNAKIMVVKAANDTAPKSPTHGYQGIVYAAEMGANIINCSWGSGGGSNFGRETVAYADSLGAVLIGAAGNEYSETKLFPASFQSAFSIAATNNLDRKALFSNWHVRVDMSAPGTQIYMPWSSGGYSYQQGTSFSAPLVSGIVAMVKGLKPGLTNQQAAQLVRVTSDPLTTLDTLVSKMGYGRVNAYRAVTETSPAIRLEDVILSEGTGANQNGIYDPGETVDVLLSLKNYLNPASQVVVRISTEHSDISMIQSAVSISQINTLQTVQNSGVPLRFSIAGSAIRGQIAVFRVDITDAQGYADYAYFDVPVAPLYGTLQNDHVRLTLTSTGRLGYVDYPENSQGEGFMYKDHGSLLFEGAFMAGINAARVSDVARGGDQESQEKDFSATDNGDLVISIPGSNADETGYAVFQDVSATNPLNLQVTHTSYSFYDASNRDYIIFSFLLENTGHSVIQNCYAGLFADWDVEDAGANVPGFSDTYKFGYISDPSAGLYGGIQVLNHVQLAQFKSIHNSVEIYDGYTEDEKWQHLSGGIQPIDRNDPADYSHVVGIGPFTLNPSDNVRLGFAMMAGTSVLHLQQNATRAIAKWQSLFPGDTTISPPDPLADRDTVYQNYPNPFASETTIEYDLTSAKFVRISIYNLLGQEVYTLVNQKQAAGTQYPVTWQGETMNGKTASGIYFYRFEADTISMVKKMMLVR